MPGRVHGGVPAKLCISLAWIHRNAFRYIISLGSFKNVIIVLSGTLAMHLLS